MKTEMKDDKTKDDKKKKEIASHEIAIDDLPVSVRAYEDKNGYAIVITSEDARIGDANGKLVRNFLVRIARGDVPTGGHAHPVQVNEHQTRTVGVADPRLDENGKLFVTNVATGERMPAAEKRHE